MDWAWVDTRSSVLRQAILDQDWGKIVPELVQVAQNLSKVEVADKNRLGEPWVGAYKALSSR